MCTVQRPGKHPNALYCSVSFSLGTFGSLNLFSRLIGGMLPAKMRFCYFQVIDLTSEVNSRPNLKVWYQRLCLMTNITFVFFEGGLNSEQQMRGGVLPLPRVLSRMAKLLVPERVKQHFFCFLCTHVRREYVPS